MLVRIKAQLLHMNARLREGEQQTLHYRNKPDLITSCTNTESYKAEAGARLLRHLHTSLMSTGSAVPQILFPQGLATCGYLGLWTRDEATRPAYLALSGQPPAIPARIPLRPSSHPFQWWGPAS